MSIVNLELTFPFEITVGFRKNVANKLNIGFRDLPESDSDFIQLVANHLSVELSITDTISGEEYIITDYISDTPPASMLPQEVDATPIHSLAHTTPEEIEAVQEEENI